MANTSAAPQPGRWFVVWTQSRAEKKVASRIAAQGMAHWLPTVTQRRRWSDRWKNVALPLFPGYLFAQGDPAQLPKLLRTPGVITVVKVGGRAALLPDGFILSLRRALERSDAEPTPVEEPTYLVGEQVVVRDGPLAGLRGVVEEVRNGRRLVVWIQEIGRGVAFTMGSAVVSSLPTQS
jgi:transcription antitermination factor NusG